MEEGEEESSQFLRNEAKRGETRHSYSVIPSWDQTILCLSLGIFGACGNLSRSVVLLSGKIETLDIIKSWCESTFDETVEHIIFVNDSVLEPLDKIY